jgi:hypothetical protein
MNCRIDEGARKKNWIWIFCLIQFLMTMALARVSFSKDVVRLYLFYSEESGGPKVEEELIKPLSKKYPVEIQLFSVNQLNNYDLLAKFEKELKQEGHELPVVIIGDKIPGGEAEIRRDLEGLEIRDVDRKNQEIKMIGRYIGTLMPILFGFYGIFSLVADFPTAQVSIYLLKTVIILYPPFTIFTIFHAHFLRNKA